MSSFAKRALGLAIALAAASIMPGMTDAAGRQNRYVPVPGYVCSVGQAFQDKVWITRRLDEQGVQHDLHMDWDPKADFLQPHVRALWSIPDARVLDIDDGEVFLDWTIKEDITARGGRPKLSIELATRVRPQPWSTAPFYTKWARGGSRTIESNWSDMRAYARGTDQLYIVLRDRRGAIVHQSPFSPAIFVEGEKAIRAAMARMDMMSAAYRTQCEHVRDISDGDIVVT